jgi:hypothetical protein
MTRARLPENKKRVKLNTSIDVEINKLFNEFLEENEIYNKSKYLEELIRKDLIKNKKLNK